jgi:hypothetical protein
MRVRFTVIVELSVYEAPRGLRLAASVALALSTTALIAGCGLQGVAQRGPVAVTVTEDFGQALLAAGTVARPPVGATALEVVGRPFKATRGSSTVDPIAGAAAAGGRRWLVYINGVAATPRARVHAGDRVWWDLHASPVAPQAVVGSFPEPFLHGLGGKRLPVTVECGSGVAAACRRVATTLTRLGIPAASQVLGAASGQDSLAIMVGTWSELRGEVVATLLARGPNASGVFARFSGYPGRKLELLDAGGSAVGVLGPTAGLIAALTEHGTAPTWLVTGTDPAGVLAAAEAFAPGSLQDHFALAVGGGRHVPVPR